MPPRLIHDGIHHMIVRTRQMAEDGGVTIIQPTGKMIVAYYHRTVGDEVHDVLAGGLSAPGAELLYVAEGHAVQLHRYPLQRGVVGIHHEACDAVLLCHRTLPYSRLARALSLLCGVEARLWN